ncbi:hypothetical protein M438DRAFT_341403 [Aureobasidium pullulans EXF-150]|uniref:Uncharacterized protein n=1 Tax=Aureobasidium pullulans EXF-150 TaxID=1043002 RepID=A0A074XVS0_AURPU|nr:uncharacterized protein M438DRAFT_341403 [Aureobasidium pullulans EXF-150]KEQ89678.1 hypothetical protein M438DRAFT_341403 [Aureobasidium pullulans EXF-150]
MQNRQEASSLACSLLPTSTLCGTWGYMLGLRSTAIAVWRGRAAVLSLAKQDDSYPLPNLLQTCETDTAFFPWFSASMRPVACLQLTGRIYICIALRVLRPPIAYTAVCHTNSMIQVRKLMCS